MTEIKQKNSKNSGDDSVGQMIVITCTTCAVLLLPTLYLWFIAVFYCIGGCTVFPPELIQLGGNLAAYLPVIGLFSAIVISWSVVKLLKNADTLVQTVLTIIVTGGVLAIIFVASFYFRTMPYFDFSKPDPDLRSGLIVLLLPIIGAIGVLVRRWFMTRV